MGLREKLLLRLIRGLQKDHFSVLGWIVKVLVWLGSFQLGVPQGTVLAPPMFLLFRNDIHENLDSTLRLFADDAILYRSIKAMNDSDILQNDIDKLVSWSKTWQMQFNVTKCHTIRISRKKDPVFMDYYIDGQKLSPVNNHP